MQNQKRFGRRKILLPAVLVVGALGAAACGSSSKSGSATTAAGGATTTAAAATTAGGETTTSSGGGGATTTAAGQTGAQQAAAIVAQYSQRPTSISLTTPVGQAVPTGKTLYFIPCGVEACDAEADIIKSATDVLGWNFKKIASDGSPQQVQNAWEQVVRDKPDGVIYTATPRSQIDQYIKQAAANGTAVANCCVTDPIGDGIVWTTSTPEQAGDLAKIMAAWVVNDGNVNGNTKPGVVYVNVPDFAILSAAATQMKATYNELCPDCSYNQLDIGLADLQSAPDKIVSFLRAHPDVKYVVQSTDSAFLGLPAALKAAGLNDVKIFGEGPVPANQANIASGAQAGTMAFAFYEIMYGAVDAVVRHATGVPIVGDFQPPNWILTKDNLPSATEFFPVVPDSLAQFAKLWGKEAPASSSTTTGSGDTTSTTG